MSKDARFEDGAEAPLNLGAMDGDDLKVLAALAQDAVFPVTEMKWLASERRFALLLNRFRWEDAPRAQTRQRPVERVQSVLSLENVLGVASSGVDRSDNDMVLSLLDIEWAVSGEGPEGELTLVLAGDGAIKCRVEAMELRLRDVTRPYLAPSGHTPDHSA